MWYRKSECIWESDQCGIGNQTNVVSEIRVYMESDQYCIGNETNVVYSGTSLEGHLWNRDTFVNQETLSPNFICLFSPWNKDASLNYFGPNGVQIRGSTVVRYLWASFIRPALYWEWDTALYWEWGQYGTENATSML